MEFLSNHTILVSAYGCEPLKGSEPGVGWNWVLQMARYNRVHVITRANNQGPIEKHLPKNMGILCFIIMIPQNLLRI